MQFQANGEARVNNTQQATGSLRRGSRSCGCMIGLVVLPSLLCAGVLAIPEMLDSAELNRGVAAFNSANCAAAVRSFDRVLNSFDWGLSDTNEVAGALRNECAAFQKAIDARDSGQFGQALRYYLDFWSIYPDSGLTGHLSTKIAELFGQSHPRELAVPEACDRVGLLGESSLIPRSEDHLPAFIYHCGETYEGLEDLESALAMYEQVSREFPAHEIAASAFTAAARVRIEVAKRQHAETIDQPLETGTAPAGTTVYIVQNDSPERIRITLTGPQTLVEEIEACSRCPELDTDPQACPNRGPEERYTLQPGQYDVLVEAIGDDGVKPYVGLWTFKSGTEYARCYYIVDLAP